VLKSLRWAVFLSLCFGAASSATATPTCGPGAHWVDTCSPGKDTLIGDVIVTLQVGGAVFDVDFFTTSTVTRSAPVAGFDPNDPTHLSAINTTISVSGPVCDPVVPGVKCVPFTHPILGNASISGAGPGRIIEKTGPGTAIVIFQPIRLSRVAFLM